MILHCSFDLHFSNNEQCLTRKPGKDTIKKELQVNITNEHRCKNPQKNSSKQNPRTH